ncbi:MAG: hypothetical protein KF867_07810 [Cryobacterium sp.]|nr:hypothetical protein [Cryobacterium sp.]
MSAITPRTEKRIRVSRVAWTVGAITLIGSLSMALVGCAPERIIPMPVPSYTYTPSPSASASAIPIVTVVPKFFPDGTAAQNKDYFDYVNETFLLKNSNPGGKELINNLVAAGFDKSKMQVTPDKTAVFAIRADAIEFSVLFGDTCLIGDASAQGYRSILGPAVGDGTCLVGKTRPINW